MYNMVNVINIAICFIKLLKERVKCSLQGNKIPISLILYQYEMIISNYTYFGNHFMMYISHYAVYFKLTQCCMPIISQ